MSDEKTKELNKEPKAKKEKKRLRRVSVEETTEKLKPSMPFLFISCFSAIIVMLMICAGVFFANIKGAEQVLVPDVVGKSLEDGIIELQVKALYPNVTLRYSEDVTEKGIILEQSPEGGSIIKGFNTVTLVISRGDEEDEIPDYTGESVDDILSTENNSDDSKKKALISFAEPAYILNNSPAGTIIAQSPAAGSKIYKKTDVHFVVSKGSSVEKKEVPALEGKTVTAVILAMSESGLIYDVTYHSPKDGEVSGTVVSQNGSGIKDKYSRVSIEMSLDDSLDNEIVSGVFKKTLCDYPVPVDMYVEAVTPDGTKLDVAKFQHIGGYVSIPYSVPRGSVLKLYVLDDVKAETFIG